MIYQNAIEEFADDIKIATASIPGRLDFPNIMISFPSLQPGDCASLLLGTDPCTFRLWFAQIAAACDAIIHILMLATIDSEIHMAGFICTFYFLRLCSGTEESQPGFASPMQYLRRVNGKTREPADLQELIAQHKLSTTQQPGALQRK